MTKFIIVLHLCSMITGQCPSSHFSVKNGFETYYDCALNGYAVAQTTFKQLEENMEWDKEFVNENKIVIKFECRAIKVENI